MDDIAIRVEGLGKRFRLRHSGGGPRYRTFREDLHGLPGRLLAGLRGRRDETEAFWALKDVSFDVKRGEVLGIIGRNGAGKSTLLKVLSRIMDPTCGEAMVHGRIGSLLEVGTGFHPELTGRENIFLSGALLGMRRDEVRRRFDEIVAFAGVEKFLDTPCKHYSSGMYARLGFAVAAHLDAEILLVDEVLAVGDAEFQRKCLGKMGEVAQCGRTVLFVSHNLAAVTALCRRCVRLESGGIADAGPCDIVSLRYQSAVVMQKRCVLAQRIDREGSGLLRMTDIRFQPECAVSGGPLTITVEYAAAGVVSPVRFALLVCNTLGDPVCTCDTRFVDADFEHLSQRGTVVCRVGNLPLAAGGYRVNVWCTVADEVADYVRDAVDLTVEQGDFFGTGRATISSKHGPLLVPQVWVPGNSEDSDA